MGRGSDADDDPRRDAAAPSAAGALASRARLQVSLGGPFEKKRKGKERKGREMKGKERNGTERNGKERKKMKRKKSNATQCKAMK